MTEAEKKVSEKLESAGWKILTRGWPDFLCLRRNAFRPDKVQVMCVEVKAGRDWLSEDQAIIHTFLKRAGLPCYIVKAEEVEKFDAQNAARKTVTFTGKEDVPDSTLARDDFDQRGIPYKNRVAELERKLRKAEEKINQYEQVILKGKSQDDDCVLTS